MVCKDGQFQERIREIVERNGRGREFLLPVLHEIVEEFGHVGSSALIEVSRQMDIPIGEIHGVSSFYHFINTDKKGRYVIRLCRTISCDMAGKERIERVLCRELGIEFGETTEDGLFSLEYTNCMGMCDQAPAMMVNRDMHSQLTPEKVFDIIQKYRRDRGI